MPFFMVRNDIVNMETDAIVNPANSDLMQGRGTSRGIYLAAGEQDLEAACRRIGGCSMGKAVITPGFALKAKYIIHAVCPSWQGGRAGEPALLYSAYRESMKLAAERGLGSIAFPLLSSGNYGYPKEEAMQIAVRAITGFLQEQDLSVYLVLYDSRAVRVRKELSDKLDAYLAEHYIELIDDSYAAAKDEEYPPDAAAPLSYGQKPSRDNLSYKDWGTDLATAAKADAKPVLREESAQYYPRKKRRLEDLMERRPETFSEMLLRLIDERGLKDSEVYNKANIDRRHFSKIRNDTGYAPKKATVLSLAIALELSYDETKDLMMRAGYAFSICSKSDMIIRFFIENGQYDIFDINETLFAYGQTVLGE